MDDHVRACPLLDRLEQVERSLRVLESGEGDEYPPSVADGGGEAQGESALPFVGGVSEAKGVGTS